MSVEWCATPFTGHAEMGKWHTIPEYALGSAPGKFEASVVFRRILLTASPSSGKGKGEGGAVPASANSREGGKVDPDQAE